MKKLLLAVSVSLLAAGAAVSQDTTTEAKPTQVKTITITEAKRSPAQPAPAAVSAPAKRGPVFRPTKDQIKQVQTMLKDKSLYKGEATGTYNDETRDGIRSFQKANGLKETGTLNRATLEKMGVELTDSQKAIPVSDSSFASDETEPAKPAKAATAVEKPKKTAVFRATVDQIKEAQRMLKSKSMYAGDETGKLDDDTRLALRKFQEANSLKVTGTLNQVTLESMSIALTERQKASAEGQK